MTNDEVTLPGDKKRGPPSREDLLIKPFNTGLELEIRAQIETAALQIIEVTAG